MATLMVSWIKQSVARQTGAIVAGHAALVTAVVWILGKLALIPSPENRVFFTISLLVILGTGLFASWVAQRLLGARLAHLVEVIDGTGTHDDLARIRHLGVDEVGAIGHAVNRLLARVTSIRASMIDQGRELGKAQRELVLRTDLANKTRELAQRLEERAMLFDILRIASSSPELDLALRALVERVGQLLKLREVVFFVHDKDARAFFVRAAYGFGDEAKIVGRRLDVGEGISGMVGKRREPLVLDDLTQIPEYQGFWGLAERTGSLAAVPMTHQEQLLGVLTVTRPAHDPITDLHLKLLCAIADGAALAVRNAQLFERMRALTTHDELTGLPNEKLMRTLLESEIDRARRFAFPLSVMAIEIGDCTNATLSALANTLRKSVRKVDTLARVGATRLVLLLPNTRFAEAEQVSHKLRQVVQQQPRESISGLTLQTGAAEFAHTDDDRGEQLLSRAEEGLRAARP